MTPNLELINTLIDMYKPDGEGRARVRGALGKWTFSVCIHGALKRMGELPDSDESHLRVAEALGIDPRTAFRLVYDPVYMHDADSTCDFVVGILEEIRNVA